MLEEIISAFKELGIVRITLFAYSKFIIMDMFLLTPAYSKLFYRQNWTSLKFNKNNVWDNFNVETVLKKCLNVKEDESSSTGFYLVQSFG